MENAAAKEPCTADHDPFYLVTRLQGDDTIYDYCMHCGWVDVRNVRVRKAKRGIIEWVRTWLKRGYDAQ